MKKASVLNSLSNAVRTLAMVPVTGLEPVRCRQRRILSGYIDSVFRSNLHSTVPWKR